MNSVKIEIKPNEVWMFFESNMEKIGEQMVLIAENTDTKYAVYLECDGSFPRLSACKGDAEPEEARTMYTQKGCEDCAKQLYLKYLFPVEVVNAAAVIAEDEDDVPEMTEEQMREEEMFMRDDELTSAMVSFLETALSDEAGYVYPDVITDFGKEFVNEVLECVLTHLAFEQGFEVYRPTIYIDEETGAEMYVKFPYNEEVIE